MIIASASNSSVRSRLAQGKKKSPSCRCPIRLQLDIGPTKKKNENRILVKITTKEYEGYRKIIKIAKKHGEVEKNKNGRNPNQTQNKQSI